MEWFSSLLETYMITYHGNANKNSNIEKVLAKMLKNRHLDSIDGV